MTEYKQYSAGFEVAVDELPELDDERWAVKLRKITDTFADEQMKLLIERISEATQATGNVVHAAGDPLSEAHLLQLFDKVQLDFEGGDISPGYAFLTSPEMGKKMAEMQVSDDFNRQFNKIKDRQRLEWRLREADRKLVD